MSNVESKCVAHTTPEYLGYLKTVDSLYHKNYEIINDQTKKGNKVELDLQRKQYSLDNPLVISKSLIKAKIETLKIKLSQAQQQKKLEKDLSTELLELRSNILRLQFNDCRKEELAERKGDDPRSFLFLQDYCESKECFQASFANSQERSVLKNHLFEVCSQVMPKDVCALQIESHGRKKELDNFLIETKSRYLNEKYAKFYSIKENELKKLKLNCIADDPVILVKIPIIEKGSGPFNLQNLIKWIKDKWDNELLVFEFEENIDKLSDDQKRRVLTINWIDSATSYVDWSNPNQINLSQRIGLEQMILVAPHEFGHFLGFPDCYIEYMNQKSEIIYFELPSEKNLMCSMGNGFRIPQFYIEQVRQKLCQ